ncbi:hypothetical protein [Actinoplanes sp. NPDC049316]|uniref:hypothetical protein n=1 Tax=Actinoplanes sp. NPDC049316 TaxID=3154727 RepID=UPI003432384C
MQLWDLDTGRGWGHHWTATRTPSAVLAFSPDGHPIAVAGGYGPAARLWLFDLPDR